MALSRDVERLYRKQYIGYRIGKQVFCSVIPQKRRRRLVLNLDPHRAAGHPLARDLSTVGHWGVGNLELVLDSEESVDDVMRYVSDAATLATA